MNILIFIVILAVLVLVHEFGHFIVAKKSGIRVDEFGLGFPPTLWKRKFGETVYALNSVPFGGYVKIFGENAESLEAPDGTVESPERSFAHKNRLIQAAVIGAGVSFNILFAWLVISVGLMFGMPTAVTAGDTLRVTDAHVIVTSVIGKSPAEEAGLRAGDSLISLSSKTERTSSDVTAENIKSFIGKSAEPITISYKRGKEARTTILTPTEGIVEGGRAIGITMETIGTATFPPHKAIIEGGIRTAGLFKAVVFSIFNFLKDAVVGHANLSSVAGPVGMVALVGDARELGFSYIIFFTALLSINLAVINLIPFPALDGGRLAMIAIEAIKRSPLKPILVQTINTVGFALLILLMIAITFHDIVNLF